MAMFLAASASKCLDQKLQDGVALSGTWRTETVTKKVVFVSELMLSIRCSWCCTAGLHERSSFPVRVGVDNGDNGSNPTHSRLLTFRKPGHVDETCFTRLQWADKMVTAPVPRP